MLSTEFFFSLLIDVKSFNLKDIKETRKDLKINREAKNLGRKNHFYLPVFFLFSLPQSLFFPLLGSPSISLPLYILIDFLTHSCFNQHGQ